MRLPLYAVLSALSLVALAPASPPILELDPYPVFEPEGKPLDGLIITLDAGHGGSSHDFGYSGSARGVESGVIEGDLNMMVTALLRHHLEGAGAVVHMTRWDDRKVSLGTKEEPTDRSEELGSRVRRAEDTASHLFLSLHHNSTTRATADGVVILIWPTDKGGDAQPLESAYADILREEVEKKVHHKEVFPHYQVDHPLVSFSDIPSAVVEFGFLSNPEFDRWVARRGSHIPEAEGVYHAIVRMWNENREALEAQRRALFPEAKPAVREARKPGIERMAASYWTHDRAPETPAEIHNIIELYRRAMLSDRTTYHVDLKALREGDEWVLRGAVNDEKVRGAITDLLNATGIENLRNELRLLPAESLGDEKYGVTQVPMAMTWAAPAEHGTMQSQILLGDTVFLLDANEDGSYYLLQDANGYVGWVRREAIRRMDAAEFREWNAQRRAIVTADHVVGDFRVPAGAHLPLLATDDDSVSVALPKGVRATDWTTSATLPMGKINLPEELTAGYRAAMAAAEFLTTPYVFGARSRTGLDCSGLTSVAYQAVGVTLPRDTFQQTIVGRLVATPWNRENLLPGDLVFFVDDTGRTFHVGVSLGGSRFIHSSPPQVHISSFDPEDELYSKFWTEAFSWGRRPAE